MTTSWQNSTASAADTISLQALCRREAWRFASWWTDVILMGIVAAASWILAQQQALRVSINAVCGPITATALGLCVGASLLLLTRSFGAWRLGRRLKRGRGSAPKAGLRSQFLAAALHESGTSAMRCSDDDLRRTASIAVSEAVRAGLNTAMPATLAAFIAPAIALIGGLDMAKRTAQESPIVAMAPSMIAGVGGGLVVVLLVHAFTTVIRTGVERWGASLDLEEVALLAGRPISRSARPTQSDDQPVDGSAETSSSTVGIDDYEQTLRNLTRPG